jgi:class 3 adenylate cyclase
VATCDGPARAIECACACAIRDGAHGLDLDVRVGLHTGEIEIEIEIEIDGDDISGLAVNVSARIQAKAEPSEVLASRTVKDLVAGSRFHFEKSRQPHLEGRPGYLGVVRGFQRLAEIRSQRTVDTDAPDLQGGMPQSCWRVTLSRWSGALSGPQNLG